MDKIKDQLSDDNLLKLAQNGVDDLSNTIKSLGDLGVDLPKTFSDVNNYTSNITNNFKDWNNSIDILIDKIGKLNNLNIASIPSNITARNTGKTVTIQGISIPIEIHGSNDEIIKQMNELKEEIPNIIENKIGNMADGTDY